MKEQHTHILSVSDRYRNVCSVHEILQLILQLYSSISTDGNRLVYECN